MTIPIKSIVLKYPNVFGVVSDSLTENEYIQIIAGAKSKGSEIQKTSFLIHDMHAAVSKLIDMGFTQSGVEMAKQLLDLSSRFHKYEVSASTCQKLQREFYKYGDLETAENYDQMFHLYTKTYLQEYEAQKLYSKAIYNRKHGLPVDKEDIYTSMNIIASKLKIDSCLYHYFYYQCLCIVTEKDEYVSVCHKAIDYFENLYFRHDSYVQTFRNKLIKEYISMQKYKLAKSQLQIVMESVVYGTERWFDAMYLSIILMQSWKKFKKASRLIDEVFEHPKFDQRPDDHIIEWESLHQDIISELNKSQTKQGSRA